MTHQKTGKIRKNSDPLVTYDSVFCFGRFKRAFFSFNFVKHVYPYDFTLQFRNPITSLSFLTKLCGSL